MTAPVATHQRTWMRRLPLLLPGVRRMVVVSQYFRFELPRSTTILGVLSLLGVVAIHCFWLAGHSLVADPPGYLTVYLVLVSAVGLAAAMAMALSKTAGTGWSVGSVMSVLSIAGYVVSRSTPPTRLAELGGRWDYALGTLSLALAAVFCAVHASIIVGVNIAYPRRRAWRD